MKKIIQLKCANCGADLKIEEKREVIYCQYCGTKMLLDDENEHTYRYIDEAEIKRAETEQMVKLKELELKEKRQERSRKQDTSSCNRKTKYLAKNTRFMEQIMGKIEEKGNQE